MTETIDRAEHLTSLRPDRFGEVREQALAHCAEHGCDGAPATPRRARELAVLTRATHASYVLEFGTGLGYSGLHTASSFGHTGRLDTIEHDPIHAGLAEENFRRFALGERVRVNRGRIREVVAALNGPYDLAVLDSDPADYPAMFEDILRLVRVGGSILVHAAAASPGLDEYLERLAEDVRVLPAFSPLAHHAVAFRVS